MAADNNTSMNTLYGSDMSSCLNNFNMLKTFSQAEYARQSGGLNDESAVPHIISWCGGSSVEICVP